MSLTAYAEDESESFTTNTCAGTYTGKNIQITGTRKQDSYGDSTYTPWTISSLHGEIHGEIIKRIDMTIGFYGGQGRVNSHSSDHGELANVDDRNDGGFSFINVNSASATITSGTGLFVQVKRVTVYYTAASAHPHAFTYSLNDVGDKITATCSATGCTLPPSTEGGTDHVATLTIAAPTTGNDATITIAPECT